MMKEEVDSGGWGGDGQHRGGVMGPLLSIDDAPALGCDSSPEATWALSAVPRAGASGRMADEHEDGGSRVHS